MSQRAINIVPALVVAMIDLEVVPNDLSLSLKILLYLVLPFFISTSFISILGSFLYKLTQILGLFISTAIFTGSECFW